MRQAVLSMDEVLSDPDLWLCSTCFTCYERCPRSVPVTEIILKLRNLASQKGYMMPPHKALTHILFRTGHGVPLAVPVTPTTQNAWTKLRESFGLPPLPPTTHSHESAVEEVSTLMKSLNFDKLVGFPPEEGDN
jgi:heterodisulfide reductase subunit C